MKQYYENVIYKKIFEIEDHHVVACHKCWAMTDGKCPGVQNSGKASWAGADKSIRKGCFANTDIRICWANRVGFKEISEGEAFIKML